MSKAPKSLLSSCYIEDFFFKMDYRHHGLRAPSAIDSFSDRIPQGSGFYFPIDGDWISECWDLAVRRRALHRHFWGSNLLRDP